MWIDTHCHPFAKAFAGEEEAVIARAREAGVEKMVVVGFSPETNRQVLEMVPKYDFMRATMGVHPCEASQLTDEELQFIRENAARIVAIGETGLDFHHMSETVEVQEEAFRKQIRLAKELNLPVIVHSRNAAEDTLRVLIEENAEKVIFHCYTYDYEFGKKAWERGYFTSFSGILTYPQASDIQEAARRGPLDLFHIETDCPYLPPQSIRGKRNEMSHVAEVGEKLASLRGITTESLAEQLRRNYQAIFS